MEVLGIKEPGRRRLRPPRTRRTGSPVHQGSQDGEEEAGEPIIETYHSRNEPMRRFQSITVQPADSPVISDITFSKTQPYSWTVELGNFTRRGLQGSSRPFD